MVSTGIPTGGGDQPPNMIYMDVNLFSNFQLRRWMSWQRFGELLDIDRERDINLETNTIDINTQVTREGSGKPLKTTASRRRIFVQPKVLRAVLEMTPRSKETTKLWLNHGRQVTYMAASMRVHNFISRSHEVPKGFTFHCFRHYHVTYLLMQVPQIP